MAKLIKLSLRNYRNIESIDLDFEGQDGKIIGSNRIGKTNVLESIVYLLTDKLLGGSSDIPSIKPQNNTRAKVSVEGIFRTEEGDVAIRKEFYEKWTRPRGGATEELQGHATDYYINGAKQARTKDFFEKLEEKFGIPSDFNGLDAYQTIIDPFYLAKTICGSKDWKSARKAVMEIVGEVTPEEIYAKEPNASIAKADLESHQYDDGEAKKAIRGEIDGYKKKMAANEGLIAEYRSIADVDEQDLAKARAEDESLAESIAKLKAGVANPYAEEVSNLQAELFDKQSEYQLQVTAPIDHEKSEKARIVMNRKSNELADIEREAEQANLRAEFLEAQLHTYRLEIEKAKSKLKELKEQSLALMVEDTCPTCGQKLPIEKMEEAANKKRAQLVEEATRVKTNAIQINDFAKGNQAEIEALKNRDFQAEIEKAKAEYLESKEALEKALEAERKAITEPDPKLQSRIAEINNRLAEIRNLQSEASKGNEAEIQNLKYKRSELQATFSKHIAYEQAQKRLAELAQEARSIGSSLANAEQRLWAVGEFVKAKLVLLDEHMASKFGEVRFQLIKENIKAGSYDEVCVPYIVSPITLSGTKTLFPDGSMSEQIFTGIQIIKAVRKAKHWQPLPILFDQGGELDSFSAKRVSYEAEAQIIAVKVEGDNKAPKFVPFE